MELARFIALMQEKNMAITCHGQQQLRVLGLTSSTKSMQPSDLFVAVPGAHFDPLEHLDQIASAGLTVIMGERPINDDRFVWLQVPHARRALALAAAIFFPGQPNLCVGVTGTNGKTSTVDLLRQIWSGAGINAASLGTLGLVRGGMEPQPGMTTPDQIALHKMLHTLSQEGCQHLAMEVSSHGLHQHRVDGVTFQSGAFTNLSRDHLDYHVSMEAYLEAKLELVRRCIRKNGLLASAATGEAAIAIHAACEKSGVRLWDYHKQDLNFFGFKVMSLSAEGAKVHITSQGHLQCVTVPFIARFQLENLALAAVLAFDAGLELGHLALAMSGLQPVRGRMEFVGRHACGAAVFVDYAHTPDALETALKSLRQTEQFERIGVVFGCGGDRDRGKRPMMGEVAAAHADFSIVTDDNPRSEDPQTIRDAILATHPRAIECGDRKEAICLGIKMLSNQDVLLVAGKGHEQGQVVGGKILPFDDADIVRTFLAEHG